MTHGAASDGLLEAADIVEIDTSDAAGYVYDNLEDESLVPKIDAQKLTVEKRWPTAPCASPSSMAIDRPNRRLFLDRLERSHAQAQRDSSFRYALLLADIDGFKSLNHRLGSAAGDQALIEISRRLEAGLRKTEVLSRPTKISAI